MSLRRPQRDPERSSWRGAGAGRSRGASVTAGILLGAFLATELVVVAEDRPAMRKGSDPGVYCPIHFPRSREWLPSCHAC